jgi:glucosylceramidase
MNKFKSLNVAVLSLLCCASISAQQVKPEMRLTDPQGGIFFQSITAANVSSAKAGRVQIVIDPKQRYQSIDGFGFTLTGGSAMVMAKMSRPARAALIRELFAIDRNNIGTSYLRISIGASDLDDHVFSYDDLPAGETDTALRHFSLGSDTVNLIPVLKEILRINPAIKILGSPWSTPVWMKTNGDTRG